MSSRMKSLALAFFLVCFAVMQIVSVSPVMADSPPVLNANTDPKILREYVKKSDEIIKAKGGKAEYYATKAQLLEWLKDYRGAVTEYSKAIEALPLNANYLVGRARCYRLLNELSRSDKDYSKAILAGENSGEALTGRALVRLSLGDYKGVISDSERAILLNPKEVVAWYAKGSAESHLGLHAKGISSLTTAIELNPRDPDLLLRRSQIYFEIGERKKAKEDLAQYRQCSRKH